MGKKKGETVNISDVFESYGTATLSFVPGCFQTSLNAGAYAAGNAVGQISDEERFDVVRHACPGPGACGGMFTANTMSSVLEVLGISLPYSSSTPAVYPGMCMYPEHNGMITCNRGSQKRSKNASELQNT